MDEYGFGLDAGEGGAAAADIADCPMDESAATFEPLAGRIFIPAAVGDCTGAFMMARACAAAVAALELDEFVRTMELFTGVAPLLNADDTRGRLTGEEAKHQHNGVHNGWNNTNNMVNTAFISPFHCECECVVVVCNLRLI